ncbi:DUF1850 domain-containing protein [Siminovitchia fortis]|uniref:DUF1850 domain-containing protein n=1 Tax=Siminovitchia fortis TaxID=254758 RepID=A0A443IKP4_9BACI|nr:DUF1850 domain-containing protein [Siminovitchia fortis]RWR05533.1 DUF1850 domain-containing protein [Siminovitchia fortis]WHY83531.1 DUF1850 domain-containing protein [Siminovitchia fortis]
MPRCLKLLFIPFIIIILLAVPITDSVTIESQKEHKLLAFFPLRAADSRFQIVYTHSIHHSEVKESYRVLKNGTIRQTELEYEDTAVGMPANAEEGETFRMKDGKYYIRNMKRDFPWIDLSTGQVSADHRLVAGEKVTPFKEFAEPGSVVRIKKRKLSLWQQWKGVNLVDR